jgi:hypothetical protein
MTLTSGRTPVEYLPRGKFIAPSAADNESAARNYGRQYASLYWYRLESIKPHLLLAAQQRWSSSQEGIAILLCTITLPSKITLHKDAVYVDRLLDIKAGELCFVIGTVYMDMPMKPNVLERLEQDVRLPINYSACKVLIFFTVGNSGPAN